MIIYKTVGFGGRCLYCVSYKGVECFNYDLAIAIKQAYESNK